MIIQLPGQSGNEPESHLVETFIVRLNPGTNAIQTVTPTSPIDTAIFLNTTNEWVRVSITVNTSLSSIGLGSPFLIIPPAGGSLTLEFENSSVISALVFQAFTFPVATGTVINANAVTIPGATSAGGAVIVTCIER